MLTLPDFSKKQIVFIMSAEGEKIAIKNDNIIVKDKEGNTKFQITCYRIFLICIIGSASITTVLIRKAKQYGFFIAVMSTGFHLYDLIGAAKEGNTLLKKKQYSYESDELAIRIAINKINNQQQNLKDIRRKSEAVKEAIVLLEEYKTCIAEKSDSLSSIMAYEGLASKIYFKNHFSNVDWKGRQPRIKRDYINSIMDIGYTILFSFIDALLQAFGFDTYCGVMHTQFYMRKSLVCDLVEPFRPLIDKQIKTAINLKRFQEKDFKVVNLQYQLEWKKSPEYSKILFEPIIEHKEDIFSYIQSYYRAFMKGSPIELFPEFIM